MIKEVSGDILQSGAQAIAHGVAPNDHFSSGLALSLREQWPALYKDFRHYCQTFHPEAGGLWAWSGAGGPRIANLLTQAAAASTEDEANKLYGEAEAMLGKDLPTTPLWYPMTTVGWSDRVENVAIDAFGVLDYAAISVK